MADHTATDTPPVQPAVGAPFQRGVRRQRHARYRFLWRRRDVERPHNEGGWQTKTIQARSDADAAEKMLDHCGSLGHPVEIDYEMCRVDVPYDSARHAETFWDMRAAGVPLDVN